MYSKASSGGAVEPVRGEMGWVGTLGQDETNRTYFRRMKQKLLDLSHPDMSTTINSVAARLPPPPGTQEKKALHHLQHNNYNQHTPTTAQTVFFFQADFARAAKVISGKELSPECVWLVFKIFDRGADGKLDHDELIEATRERLRRLPGQRDSPASVARFAQCARGDSVK